MRLALVLLLFVAGMQLATARINAVFSFGGLVEDVKKCCPSNPLWFSLWHTFPIPSLPATALEQVVKLSLTTWQPEVKQRPLADAVTSFRGRALSGRGPSLLLAPTYGLLELARCGALAPWEWDATLSAALSASHASELVSWSGRRWALPLASDAAVLYYNRALQRVPVASTLDAWAVQACAGGVVLDTSLHVLEGFFLGSELFPGSATTCFATPTIQNVASSLHALALRSCAVLASGPEGISAFLGRRAAFLTGRVGDLGRLEAMLGADLGVAPLPRATAGSDTRAGLSMWVLYANARSQRQAAVDWSSYAASLGQAGVLQRIGRLVPARSNVPHSGLTPWESINTAAAANITQSAWVAPNTPYYHGLDGNRGFVGAFSPFAALIGRAGVSDGSIRSSVVRACACMNGGTACE